MLLLLLFHLVLCFSMGNRFLNRPKPAPFTDHNRILSVILSYNINHFESVGVILHEYSAMCEAGWAPTVVLLTFSNYTAKMQKLVQHKTYCSRNQRHLPVVIETNYNISSSRRYFAEHLDEHDLFVYQEDDMILRVSHIAEFVKALYRLNEILPASEMQDKTVGFLRYRRDNVLHPPYLSAKDTQSVRDAQEEDVVNMEFIEEEPSVGYLCLAKMEEPWLHFGGNLHQAFWILVRDQIDYMQTKCQFLNQSKPTGVSGTIEYTSDMSIWDRGPNKHNPAGGCGMTKMMPPEVERFSVLHYYPGARRSRSRHSMYSEIRRFYVGNRAFKGIIPDCWQKIVANAKAEEARGI